MYITSVLNNCNKNIKDVNIKLEIKLQRLQNAITLGWAKNIDLGQEYDMNDNLEDDDMFDQAQCFDSQMKFNVF